MLVHGILVFDIRLQDDGYPRPRVTFTTLKVFVVDDDDQGPAFLYDNCPLVDGYCATPSYEAIMEESFQVQQISLTIH